MMIRGTFGGGRRRLWRKVSVAWRLGGGGAEMEITGTRGGQEIGNLEKGAYAGGLAEEVPWMGGMILV